MGLLTRTATAAAGLSERLALLIVVADFVWCCAFQNIRIAYLVFHLVVLSDENYLSFFVVVIFHIVLRSFSL